MVWGKLKPFALLMKSELLYIFRIHPHVVKIIGLSSGIYGGPSLPLKYCQMWFKEQRFPVISQAEYNIVPETHDKKYAVYVI